ncbi:MAG: hypothetical protein Q8L85_01540, partial [Alphaproteobacteria bacterium]|nr:hypothetical protein [Alphaproteobacteria bacterium]
MPKDFIDLPNSKKSKLSSRTTMRLLEQRFMFDAAIATTVADAQNTSDPHLDAAVHNDINAKPLATDASHDTNTSQNIDPSKDTSKTILSDFTANAATTPKQTTQVTDEKSAISYMNGLPL